MEITQDIQEICAELLERYKQGIKDSGHSASGDLVNTARYFTTWNGRYFVLYFNLQEYWKYLENGTQPHFPPVEAIEKWIRVKHIIPTTNSGRVPSTKQLAFIIARGISVKGTKPTKILQHTIDNSDDLLDRLVEAFQKQLQDELNKEEL